MKATDASTPPSPSAPAPPGKGTDAPAGSRSVTSFLLAHGLDVKRESVRIVAGFGLLLFSGVALLNVTLWHNAGQRIEEEAWRRLEVATDVRTVDVDNVLDVFRREALSIARDPEILGSVRALPRGAAPARRDQALRGLYARATEFEFRNVTVTDAEGSPLGEWRPRSAEQARIDTEAAREAAAKGAPAWGSPRAGRTAIAIPLAGAAGTRVLLFHGDFVRTLQPLLRSWPGFGEKSGAYLVRADADGVEFLSRVPNSLTVEPGLVLPMTRPEGMAAAMAATRVASRVELPGERGDAVWSVTRPLQNADWGLVAQAQRSEMMSTMSSVRQALVTLDVVFAGVFLAVVLLWRRSTTRALARREVELTDRHARRLRSILDTAFDAIFTFDQAGRVRSANRAAETLVGLPTGELLDQPISKFIHWGVSGKPVAMPQAWTVVSAEAVRPDRSRVPVEFTLGRSGEGDDPLFTAIVRDVRDRVEAERRIRESHEELEQSNRRLEEMNAQLEESSRLKSEFLANTSHELRTPLNGMIGFLQLVLDGLAESREEELDFLKQALECSRHLLGLINDVLDIAKIEAGKLALDLTRIDLRELFDEVHTVTHVQAAQKGLRLSLHDDTAGKVNARGDFGKIKQVLINLVGNSLKFTPKGEIQVRARAHAGQSHLVIEVVDTGIGIAPDRQHLVFDKFVQADGSTTRRFGGTGLGLAISKSLVELMGGVMGVQSDGENKGTTVYFSVPLWRDEDTATENPTDADQARIEGSPEHPLVLIVEDDGVFRRFVATVLQRSGYRTVEADHAELAWALVRRLSPDVVLLDYALSCQDGAGLRTGWDLAQRMTSEPRTRHIPVVFVTGFDGELKRRLHSTAFARRPEHLVKPVDPATLVAKLSALAGEHHNRIVRVLMADDDPAVATYVRRVLPADRYVVDVATNGEECLHTLRTHPDGYDVLLLDLMMPEVSGYDVLREMTLSGLQPELPVMVLTNYPEPQTDEERRLLKEGLVLDIVSKTAVHDNPQLLPHVLDWHLHAASGENGADAADPERKAA